MDGGPVRLFANEAGGEPGAGDDDETGFEGSAIGVEAAEGEVILAEEGDGSEPTIEQTAYEEGGTSGTDNEAWRLKEKRCSPEKLVQNARADLGSDKWAPKEINGKTNNQCNIYIASKLRESGAHVPNVGGKAGTFGEGRSDTLNEQADGRIGGQPPSANDWHKDNVPGYDPVKGAPQPGDIASDGSHVGIVSGAGKTISVTTANPKAPEYGHVIENDWGFRKAQEGKVTFWRNNR